MSTPPTIEQVASWLAVLTAHGGAVEIRAFRDDGRPVSKVFPAGTDPREIAVYALALDKKCKGVYFTLNPLRANLSGSAKDKDVESLYWLPIDIDPVRPADVSATDAEKKAARIVADALRAELRRRGWPDPIVADSGNGRHHPYRIDLPNDAASKKLVRNVLRALARLFDTEAAKVDTAVGNASRIFKVYGTTPRKGEPTAERPHRPSVVLKVPDPLEPVPVELLEALAAEAEPPKAATPPEQNGAPRKRTPNATGGDPLRAYVESAFHEEVQKVAAVKKNRNIQLNTSALKLGQLIGAGQLDRADVETALTAAARQCGLGESETVKTIASGLDAGIAQPRDLSGIGTRSSPERNGSAERNGSGSHRGGTSAPPVQPNEAPDDPHRLGRLYLAEHCSHPDGRTLRYWKGEFHLWTRGAYRKIEDKELRAKIANVVKTEFDAINVQAIEEWNATGGKGRPPTVKKVVEALKTNILGNLAGMVLLPEADVRESPAWLTDPAPWPAEEVLPARNALVHLPSLVDGRDYLRDPTPNFFGSWCTGYDFDANAGRPALWLEFLDKLWRDDPESIGTLQEWFGYCLTADTRQQKILTLIGPLRSGKGTIGRVLQAIVGAENVSGVTLAGMTTNFGLSPLIGTPLAVISDARLSGRTDQAVIVERLLSISGEDTLTIDRKHVAPWTGKLPTRFVLISNELPRLIDTSGALAGRLVLLRLTESFYGREDPDLTEKLLPELPGILLWAIEGWRRLRERGRFVQPESGRELVEEMADLTSPVGTFIRACCDTGAGLEVTTGDLYSAWCRWCETTGRKQPGDAQNFGRNLRASMPQLKTRQTRVSNEAVRLYVGIDLKPAQV